MAAKTIVGENVRDYQLIVISIEIVHKILGIAECDPKLMNNPHVAKVSKLAALWNEKFIDLYVSSKEGGI